MPHADPTRPTVAIVGPTAAGKSAVAMALAQCDPTVELLSVDSMQVYRGMDVGTAKPTEAEQAAVRHHLIDLIDPHESMHLVDFTRHHDDAIAEIDRRGGRGVLVGGTGLYLRAVVDRLTPPPKFPEVEAELEDELDTEALHARLVELDPLAASRMEPANRRRVVRALEVTIGSGRPFSSFGPGMEEYPPSAVVHVGVDVARPLLDERIHRRYAAQVDAGFLDEVTALLDADPPWSRTAAQALGYKELALHVTGDLSLADAVALAEQRTRRFARRQQRWFRRDPRITWFEHAGDPLELVERIEAHVQAATADA